MTAELSYDGQSRKRVHVYLTGLSYRWDKKVSTPFINISVNGESVTRQTANGWVFDENLTHWCLFHNGIWHLHWDKQHLTDFSESVKSHDYVSRAVEITDTNPEILTRLYFAHIYVRRTSSGAGPNTDEQKWKTIQNEVDSHLNKQDIVWGLALRLMVPAWRTTPIQAIQRETATPPTEHRLHILSYCCEPVSFRLNRLEPQHPLWLRTRKANVRNHTTRFDSPSRFEKVAINCANTTQGPRWCKIYISLALS